MGNLTSLPKLVEMQNTETKVAVDLVFMCNFGICNEELAGLDVHTKGQ